MGKKKQLLRKQDKEPLAENTPYATQGTFIIDQSKTKKESLRPLFDVFLFITFLASLALYFNQDELFGEDVKHNDIVVNITIEDLLLNKTGLIDDNVDRFLNKVQVGSSIEEGFDIATRDFIDESYNLLVKANDYETQNVLIFEIVDKEKQRIKINNLLVQARNYFDQDKLTTPKFENAFSKYQYVLSLDPSNQQALQGIQNIVNRYIFFIDKVIDKKEFFKIPILIESVKSVGEGYVDTKFIVDNYKEYLSEEDLFYYSPRGQYPKNSINTQKNVSKTHYMSKKVIEADYQISQVSIDLIKNGKTDVALKILNEFVKLYPAKSQAYDLLLQLYLDKGDTHLAENIIYQNVQFESVYLAEKTARVFIARGDYKSALTLLESHKPKFSSNPDYYYLLAGLYLKLHDYNSAHEIYEKLVIENRYNAYYWFGLAVTLEAKGDDGALMGFSVAKKIAIKGSLIDQYYQYDVVG